MIGIFLVAAGEIFAELATSIGKYEVKHKKESLYAMGFLNALFATVFLILIGIFIRGNFIFSLESLPTFILRAVLEIILVFITLHAVLSADRSTFTFLRTITIPLLLVTDIALGYLVTFNQVVGIFLIVLALIILLLNHGLSRKGKILSVISALLAVGTISLYKYNITHYNSVEGEQIVMHLIVLAILIIAARLNAKENVFKYLKDPVFLLQSLASGVASVFISFAYLFAPASVITTSKRSLEILTSVATGRAYFHEKHIVIKVIAFLFILAGTVLMVY